MGWSVGIRGRVQLDNWSDLWLLTCDCPLLAFLLYSPLFPPHSPFFSLFAFLLNIP